MLLKIKNFLFNNTNVRQTIIKNTFWLSVGSITSKIIRAILVIYAARVLGAGEYGVFSYALGLVSIFSIFADVGLSPLLTRELSRHAGEEKKQYVSSIILSKFALVALSLLLVVIFSPLISNITEATKLLPLVGLLVALDNLRSFGLAIVRAENRMEKEAKISFFTEALTAILGGLVLIYDPSVKNLIISYIVGSGIGTVAVLSLMKEYFRNLIRDFRKSMLIRAFRSAAPYATIGILGMFMTNIDIYFLGRFMDSEAVGLYSAALRPVTLLYLLPAFLTIAIFPMMNKYVSDNNNDALKNLSERGISATLAFAIPLAVGGLVMGGSLIHNIFGAEYSGSIASFKILILTVIPIFPGMILSHMLFSKDSRVSPVKVSVTGAVINVILDIILIPMLGIIGSAIATLSAQLAMNSLLFFEARKVSRISLPRGLWKTVLASIIMGIAVHSLLFAGWNTLLIIFTGAMIYVGLLYVLKEKLLAEIISSIKNS